MSILDEKVKEIGRRPDFSNKNLLAEIKYDMQRKDRCTYREWKSDNFNLNHTFFGNYTLLHFAADHGVVHLAEFLIQNGADVDAVDRFKTTPLHHAARYGKIEVMKILIEKGANVNAVSLLDPPLHTVIKQKSAALRTSMVKLLIENGADIEARSKIGESPLHAACKENDSIDIVRILIEKGAMTNALDEGKNTPLHHAVSFNKFDVVEVLVENGASIKVSNKAGDTPLHLAVTKNYPKIAKYLLKIREAGIVKFTAVTRP